VQFALAPSRYRPHALALGAESTRAARARIESAASFFIMLPFAPLAVTREMRNTNKSFCSDIDNSFLLAQITLLGKVLLNFATNPASGVSYFPSR
jgi:hypothetical protein